MHFGFENECIECEDNLPNMISSTVLSPNCSAAARNISSFDPLTLTWNSFFIIFEKSVQKYLEDSKKKRENIYKTTCQSYFIYNTAND